MRNLRLWKIQNLIEAVLFHGLLKCKSCSGVWNRDCNGATHIYKIVKNAINKIDRPSYLCRRNNSDTCEEVSHP